MLRSLGVDLGQGYLIGRPAVEPAPPRAFKSLQPDGGRRLGRGRARATVRRVVATAD
jgi:hypothetical protein